MSAQGIIPDGGYGGLVVTDLPPPAGVTNAYVPPSTFTVSTALRFYGANCSANRFDPQQLNAFESEMLCLAATINPNGTWNAGSTCNLGAAFTAFAASLAGGGSVSLATAADYPGSRTSEISAATPAYVDAAITAAFISPLAVTTLSDYPSSDNTLGATAAYISAAILGHLATSAAYPGSVGSNVLSATPAYVSAAVSAATTTIESLIPGRAAASSYPSASDITYTTPAYVAAAIAAIVIPARTNAAAYPSASDSSYATPAYVGAAITAATTTITALIPARTNAAAYPSASDVTYTTPAYVDTAIAAIGAAPSLTHSAAYPSASDSTASTPAYVAAAIAAIVIPARTNAAAYPSASDTTYSTPAYVAAAIAAIVIPARTNAAAYPSASDTTYATPAYVAAAVSGAGGGTLSAIKDTGSNVDTAAVALNFVGATSITTSAHVVTVTLPSGGGSSGGPGGTMTPPLASSLTAVTNLGSAVLTDRASGGGILIPHLHIAPGVGSGDGILSCALQVAPVGAMSLVTRIRDTHYDRAGGWHSAGPVFHNSAGTISFYHMRVTGYNIQLYKAKWLGAFSPYNSFTLGGGPMQGDWFQHLDYDGTNIKMGISRNGKNVVWFDSEAISGFLGAITHCGIGWSGASDAGHGPEWDVEHFYVGALGGNGL